MINVDHQNLWKADQSSHRVVTKLLLPPVNVLPVGHLHQVDNDESLMIIDLADYNKYNDHVDWLLTIGSTMMIIVLITMEMNMMIMLFDYLEQTRVFFLWLTCIGFENVHCADCDSNDRADGDEDW